MRSSLILAGGALLAAAALYGTAGTAAADAWTDWNHHYPHHCGIGVNDDATYHHVTHHGVFAGTRQADGCKHFDHHAWGGPHGWAWRGGWDHDHHHGHPGHHGWGEHHWTHRNWPTSGNGNWLGHGFGPGVGIGARG